MAWITGSKKTAACGSGRRACRSAECYPGSHHIMIKDNCRSIPIPVHGTTDLPRGLVKAILKQAGIKEK